MRAAIVRVASEKIIEALFPPGTEIKDIRLAFESSGVDFKITHPNLPDTPEGCQFPMAEVVHPTTKFDFTEVVA